MPTEITAPFPALRRALPLAFLLVLLFFFASGACGLLYQVVWTRKLVLLFGTTAYAVSTVLSIFFLGLGLGSLAGGRLADRTLRPLRLYGLFEIIIGFWAVLFILVVSQGEEAAVGLLKYFEGSRAAGIAMRALLALLLMFLPVALMGATLPLLAKYVTRSSRVRGFPIGTLYTLNTLGAVAGCFLTGFYFIATFGYAQTTFIGAAANIAAGLLALLLSRGTEPLPEAEPMPASSAAEEAPQPTALVWLVLAAFAVSGFCALALEVLWTRFLVIVFLGTTYAYTTMLTTVLCGIVCGSLFASLLVDRLRRPALMLGLSMMLTGICAAALLSLIAGLPEKVTELHLSTGNRWDEVVRGTFFLAFLVLFPTTFFFGMTFPLVVRAASRFRATVGRDIGLLYSANTFGGVLGAVAGGFLLIPILGAHGGIVFLAVLLFAFGALLLVMPPVSLKHLAAGVVLAALFLLALFRAPDDVSQALNAGYIPEDHQVLYFAEGTEGTVAVSESAKEEEEEGRVLWINRVQATASIEKGVKMNRLQGVLPLLFDRDPKHVLFMCFGSGITCGTLAAGPFERIDAVEISPEVLKAAPLFEEENLSVLNREKVHFHLDDGRNYLLRSDDRYDLITFEPMPLALAGVSTFYTKEYYELCLSRLAPGGLVSQWVPLHSLNPEVVRSLVYTFTTVFSDYTAWFINADLFLIGSNEPLRIDPARAQEKLASEELQRALSEVWLGDLAEVIGCFLMAKKDVDAYAAGGNLMSDDLPWAEFIAPRLVYERKVQDSLGELTPHASNVKELLAENTPPEVAQALERRQQSRVHDLIGVRAYYASTMVDAEILKPFFASLDLDPANQNAKYYIRQIMNMQVAALMDWEEYEKLEGILRSVIEVVPDEPFYREALSKAQAARVATTLEMQPAGAQAPAG